MFAEFVKITFLVAIAVVFLIPGLSSAARAILVAILLCGYIMFAVPSVLTIYNGIEEEENYGKRGSEEKV